MIYDMSEITKRVYVRFSNYGDSNSGISNNKDIDIKINNKVWEQLFKESKVPQTIIFQVIQKLECNIYTKELINIILDYAIELYTCMSDNDLDEINAPDNSCKQLIRVPDSQSDFYNSANSQFPANGFVDPD